MALLKPRWSAPGTAVRGLLCAFQNRRPSGGQGIPLSELGYPLVETGTTWP